MADSEAETNLGKHPLKDIIHPHPHDVLCGRGGGSNNWIGNSHWRMLVAANKQLYVTLPKRQKMLLSRSIVHAVRSQNPPGRFLQKDSKSDRWYDIGDQRAQEKTSQALREGAPELRTKLKDDNKTPGLTHSSGSTNDTRGGSPAESRSDDGGKSPAPSYNGEDDEDNEHAPSGPPSRAASGSIAAPQLAQQTSGNSIGQVLPPAAPPGATPGSLPAVAASSMPPPAMRPVEANQQQQQQQQQQFLQQQQLLRQQQQQMNNMHCNMQNMQNMQQGMHQQMHNGLPHGMLPQQAMNGGMFFPAQANNMHNMNNMNNMNVGGMQMFNQMMYNQQGMMVPVMTVMQPQAMPPSVPAQGPISQRNEGQGGQQPDLSSADSNGNGQDHQNNSQQRAQQNSHKENYQLQQQQPGQHQQQHSNNMTHFDQKLEGMALPPPEGLEAGGLSFGSIGSIMLSENEMKRLEAAGTSFGTAMSYGNNNNMSNNNNSNNINMAQQQQQQQQLQHQFLQQQYLQQQQQFMEQYQHAQQQHSQQYQQLLQQQRGNSHEKLHDDVAKAAPPPDGGLEPQGLSFGSVSMMSIGDARLEATGISFGSAMSFRMAPDMVDGGLDGIGMSFGSMTLATNAEDSGGGGGYDPQHNQHNIMPPPPPGPNHGKSGDALPTLFQQNRSSVNLLDCSDTDSDDEEQSAQRSQHKSLEWEKMKALVDAGSRDNNANQNQDHLPMPPTTSFPSSFAMPSATTFARDFSQMSALSVGDNDGDINESNLHSLMAAAAMPLPPPKKQDDDGDWQNAELLLLKTQQSGSNAYGNAGGGHR